VNAAAPPGRVLGVDLGGRRIGLAVSDDRRAVAVPHSVLERGSSHAEDHRAIAAAASELGATLVVVGLPLSLSGRRGPAARAVLAEVEELRGAAPDLTVTTHDERLTTVQAERGLRDAGVRGATRRRVVDQVAAALVLQAYLDGSR
jgi:putative Holliday junction resolvase